MEESEVYFPSAGIYEFGWLIEKSQAETERVVLVDVGGGKGHSQAATLKEYQNLPQERCVLEDRVEVIKAVKEVNDPILNTVKKVAIDFNTEQPVKGKPGRALDPY